MSVTSSISPSVTGAPTSLYSASATTATGANTTETTLGEYTASELSANGDRLVVRGAGKFAANTNTKQIRFKIGVTTVMDTTALAYDGLFWLVECIVTRTGDGTQKAEITFTIKEDAVADSTVVDTFTLTTTTAISGDIDFDLTGENGTANANDITCLTFTVDKYTA